MGKQLVVLSLALSICLSFSADFASAFSAPKNTYQNTVYTDTQYVLITGFLNEINPFDFVDWLVVFKASGVPTDNITILFPDSTDAVKKNAKVISEQLHKIVQATRRQLVIVAHSKGAVEAAAVAITEPSFWQKNVRKAYLVQGAFGGSHIADFLTGQGVEPDGKMSWLDNLIMAGQAPLTGMLIPFFKLGLGCMTTPEGNKLQDEYLKFKPAVSNIQFITSVEKKGKLSPMVTTSGHYLSAYYGENDGLILYKHQTWPWLGKVFAHFEADHLDLVMGFPLSGRGPEQRYQLASDVLKDSLQ